MTKSLVLSVLVLCLLAKACHATVNIVVSTFDGLVVAADSRVTLLAGGKTRIASDYGQKICRVGRQVAVTFAGSAHLYDSDWNLRSISSIVDLYRGKSKILDTTKTNPLAVAVGLDSLLNDLYNRHQRDNFQQGQLELMIVGYNDKKERRMYALTYPNVTRVDSSKFKISGFLDSVYTAGTPGALLKGQSDVWTRLMKGYDPRLLGA